MSLRSLAIAFSILAIPAVAAADSGDPDPRVGFFGGFGLHAGNLSCDGQNCNEFRKAGGADGHAGWGFNDKVGIVFDLYVLTSKEDNLSITQGMATVGARYWVVPIIWLQGGIGAAQASYKYDFFGTTFSDHTDNAAAVMAAVGVELIKSPRFALDVQARVGYGFYGDSNEDNEPDDTGRSASLGVGFTWF
jgi:hypothetical protein